MPDPPASLIPSVLQLATDPEVLPDAVQRRANGGDVERLQAAVDAVVAAARGGARVAEEAAGRIDDVLAAERYQRAALDNAPEAWLFLRAVVDDAGRVADFVVLDINAAGERLAERPRATVIGGSLRELFPIHERLGLFEWYLSVVETGDAFEDERCVHDTTGEHWLHVRAVPIPGGIAVATRDVGDRRLVEAANERLAAILEASPDIVAMNGTDGRIFYLNRTGRAILGLSPDATGLDAHDLTIGDVQPQFMPDGALAGAHEQAMRDGVWRGETVLRKRDGRELPVEQVLIAHRHANGDPAYFSSVLRDITDLKQVQDALRSLSLVDELSSLYNRRGFLTVAAEALERARERGTPVLVFYMDLDEFKQINDHYGHPTGDAALVEVADALRATFRESDIVARLGGDEFVAFAVHGAGLDGAAITRSVLARLQERLDAVNATGAHPYDIRLSVGVAGGPSIGDEGASARLEALLAQADAALYDEKCRRKAARAEAQRARSERATA